MVFKIIGIVVFLVFFGTYIGKIIYQNSKCIETDQIAKGKKSGKLFVVEVFMKIATYTIVVIELVSLLWDFNYSSLWLRYAGIVISCVGCTFFVLSVYTMRDSWRAGIPESDQTEMVTGGIYKISRNPAFVGFDLTYIGLLLMYFNPVLFIFTCFAVVMLHLQILQEEKYLPGVFGEAYENYRRSVCRYLGRK